MCYLYLLLITQVPKNEPDPQLHAEMAYRFCFNKDRKLKEEAQYLRFFSFYNYSKIKKLEIYQKVFRFWTNHLTFKQYLVPFYQVPESEGLLWYIDIRETNWNKAAFSSVARREVYFREPFIDSETANALRQIIKVPQQQNTDFPHVEAIVRADNFFRDTVETDRFPSYYDLLFAHKRFVPSSTPIKEKEQEFQQEVDYLGRKIFHYVDGKLVPKLKTKDQEQKSESKETDTEFRFVKFPQKEKDIEELLGVDGVLKFIRENDIDLRHGAIVEGGEIKNGSAVSRQNRLIERAYGAVGSYYKTYDVKRTSGRRDFTEQLNKNFLFDAGEILWDNPNGSLGGILVDAKGNILEIADNRFATDRSDIYFDARVRTLGSCIVCHETGYITPKDMFKTMLEKGIQIKFLTPERKLEAKAFFLDWEDKLEGDQLRHARFIKRTSGFLPGENSKNFKAWRDEYDSEIDLEKACAETGIRNKDEFESIIYKTTKARVANLVVGINMPRSTWEDDGYFEVMKQKYKQRLKK